VLHADNGDNRRRSPLEEPEESALNPPRKTPATERPVHDERHLLGCRITAVAGLLEPWIPRQAIDPGDQGSRAEVRRKDADDGIVEGRQS